jgi:hypothetical protein
MDLQLEDVRALTALWLDVTTADLEYIDQALLELDAVAEDDDLSTGVEVEEAGGINISSLYYNRPTIGSVGGVQYVYYYRDCSSSPRRRIRRDSIFRTIAAGSCISFRKYKMFYT